MTYLHKLLPLLVLPIGSILTLLILGLWLRRRSLMWIACGLLWISSTPLISGFAIRAMEGWSERGVAAHAPVADAIVVLSGGRVVAPGRSGVSEWGDADRFFGGVQLFQARKAPLLVFTGAMMPWERQTRSEGDVLADYARLMGVPDASVRVTPPVTNTAQEAQAAAAMLRSNGVLKGRAGRPRVLLVTSAFHMTRARRLFENAGIRVVPFPVDFQTRAGGGSSLLAMVPSAAALAQTELALHELFGRLFYALTGR